MSKTLIHDIVTLVNAGWRPYNAEPQGVVYQRLNCSQAKKASWFTRGDVFLCVGCARRCSLHRPDGFPPPLPINYPRADQPYSMTPQEMVTRKTLLTPYEAAYCLNCSERKIYAWIEEGLLRALKQRPYRIPAEDVRRMLQTFGP